MTFNTPLAVRVLAHIEELNDNNDELQHKQAMWGLVVGEAEKLDRIYDNKTGELIGLGSCSTAMCFAGWTNTLEGVKLHWEEADFMDRVFVGDQLGPVPEDGKILIANYTMEDELVSDKACQLLGIERPKRCANNGRYNEECDLDEDEYWEDGTRFYGCSCEGAFDAEASHWNFEDNFPKLFNAENTLADLYAMVAAYADLEVDELKAMVEDERERFNFDERLLNSCVNSDEYVEVPA